MNAKTIANLKKHDFVFLAELGEGGFGVVVKVRHEISGQEYAISDSWVSRRHLVIVNLKNDVWLYDMSTSGTYVDGERVANKSFLLGRCTIKAGGHTFYVKSDRGLLL